MYKGFSRGVLRETNVEILCEVQGLTWIQGLLINDKRNRKAIPCSFFEIYGDLFFLHYCDDDTKC